MIALLASIALGGPPVGGTAEGPVLAEPILTYARLDTQELAVSRVYGLQSVGTPLVFGMGVFAHVHQAARVGGDARFQRAGLAGAITAAAAQTSMAAAPILLRESAERSRRALVAQGLRPRRAPRVSFGLTITSGMLVAASWVGFGASFRSDGGTASANPAWLAAGGLGLVGYSAAVGVGLLQLRYNEQAREQARWWGRR